MDTHDLIIKIIKIPFIIIWDLLWIAVTCMNIVLLVFLFFHNPMLVLILLIINLLGLFTLPLKFLLPLW